MRKIIQELKRRKVFQVGIFYCVAAWPLIEIVDVVLPTFNAPEWASQVVVATFLLGFPIAIIIAWFFQITPEGIRADYGPNHSGRVLDFFLGHASADSDTATPAIAAEFNPDPKSIAILPLANLSPNPDNAYFASGVHEEILDQIAKISDIKVIARTAVLRYQDTKETPSKIARELNVSSVMEGSVRFSKNQVRITTQLIRAQDDMHLWSESYDFELDDIFAIQSDVAKKVAEAMEATLLPHEIENIERPATESSEAYTLFLRHRHQYEVEGSKPTLDEDGWIKTGITRMREAIELDPNFARGIAELGWLIWYRGLISEPGRMNEDYDTAADYAKRALQIDPNISRAYQVLQRVYFHRRQWDKWEDNARKSVELPDLDGSAAFNLGLTLALVAHYPESYVWFDVATSKNPSFVYYWELALTNKLSGADYEGALRMSEQYLAVGGDKNAYHAARAYACYRLDREADYRTEFEAIDSYELDTVFLNLFLDFMRTIMGQKDEVVATLLALPNDYMKASRIVFCGAASGDMDLVFMAYDAVMKENGHIHVSEIVDGAIRNDERFAAVEEYLHLPKQGEYLEFPKPR